MGFFDGLKNFMNFISFFPAENDLYGEDFDRLKEIDLRRNYRLGNQQKQLKIKEGQTDDNLRCNLIGKAINQSVYLLVGKGVDFDLPGDDETPEELWLNACWEANKKQILLYRSAQNAAESGNGYIKIIPDGVYGRLNGKDVLFPRLINIDPLWMTMDTNPEDFEQVIRYSIRFNTVAPDGKERARREIIEYHDADINDNGIPVGEGYWTISEYFNDHTTGGKWILMEAPIRWDYTFAPIVEWQNLISPNSIYGEPDTSDDILELQDRLNFVASNINKIIRYHAHPKTYTIGLGKPAKDSWGADQIVQFMTAGSDTKGEIANLEMQSDLKSSLEFFGLVSKSILDNTNTVDVNNLKDKLGQLTNFAVRVLFNDALSKMNIKRELFGDALRDLNHRLLTLGGFANADPGEVKFPDNVLPINEQEVINIQKQEMEMGVVSKQTVALERGRDYEEEQGRMSEEQENNTTIGAEILKTFEKGTQR